MAITLEETISKRMHAGMLSWILSRQTFWVFLAAQNPAQHSRMHAFADGFLKSDRHSARLS